MLGRLPGKIVLDCDRERLREKRDPLLWMPLGLRDARLGVEGAGQRLGQSERLGDVECELGPLARPLEIARTGVPARESGGQEREVPVGLVGRDDGEGALHALERLLVLARGVLQVGEPGRDAGGGVGVTLGLVERDRLLEQPGGRLGLGGVGGEPARPVEQGGFRERLVGQPGGLLEVALRFGGSAERGGPFAGAGEHRLRLLLDLGRVVGLRRRLVGGDVVGGDDLDHLVLLPGEGGGQVLGRCEVAGAALALGERLVGDVADEILEEAVLAVLGRARVGLDAEHLLAHERGEERLELRLCQAGESGEPGRRERLAEHGSVLEQAPLLGREAVEARRDQGVQRLRHLERADLADRPVDRTLSHEQAAVEQHPHRLDRVEREIGRAHV